MNPSILLRLKTQLDCLPEVLGSVTTEILCRRPASGKWSAHENLAHLVRHHQVMLERIQRILSEDSPRLDRYDAGEDLDWPRYAVLTTGEILEQLHNSRNQLIAMIEKLSEDQMARPGAHTRMGSMPLSTWLEFFLVHEGHHLYMAFLRARGV